MNVIDNRFKNATVLMTGGACLILVVNHLVNISATGLESPIPGFYHLAGIAYSVLCLWMGMILRQWLRNPRWWVQALVACLAVFCLYKYRHPLYLYWNLYPYLYLMLICLGYLVPDRITAPAGRSRGWGYLGLLLISVFCYTATSVVLNRLNWLTGSTLPEHQDMLSLMLTLTRDAEPMLVVLTLYFIILFSFSKTGQWLGERSWFRGIILVPTVFVFIGTLGNMIIRGTLFSTPIFLFLVQPVTIYLLVVLWRASAKLFKGVNQDYPTWKDIFMI